MSCRSKVEEVKNGSFGEEGGVKKIIKEVVYKLFTSPFTRLKD